MSNTQTPSTLENDRNYDAPMQAWEEGELMEQIRRAWLLCESEPGEAVALSSYDEDTRAAMRTEILRQVGDSWQSIDTSPCGKIWQVKLNNGSILQVRSERF
jgi:hypothetical protein